MANICEYKIIVKGKKNACYAFFGSMLSLDFKDIEEEKGTDDNFELFMHGTCKWSVNSYCSEHFDEECPIALPDDPKEAETVGEDYTYYVQERSRIFGVEVLCCSCDIDEGVGEYFEHYNCGELISDDIDDCPNDLLILEPLEEGYGRCCACGLVCEKEYLEEYEVALFCGDCLEGIKAAVEDYVTNE